MNIVDDLSSLLQVMTDDDLTEFQCVIETTYFNGMDEGMEIPTH